MLAGASLPLPLVDLDAHALHRVTDGGDELPVVASDQDVVIGMVMVRRLEVDIPRGPGLPVGRPEEIELQLGRESGGAAFQPGNLASEYRPRRMIDRCAAAVGRVADDQRGAGIPGRKAHSLETRQEDAIGIAPVRSGHGQTIERDVLDARDQVKVRHRQTMSQDRFPPPGRDPLADQTTVQVGKDGEHGVDLAPRHQVAQTALVEHAGGSFLHPRYPVSSLMNSDSKPARLRE